MSESFIIDVPPTTGDERIDQAARLNAIRAAYGYICQEQSSGQRVRVEIVTKHGQSQSVPPEPASTKAAG